MTHEGLKLFPKRGCKYPERVMNHSKSCTSVMFACTGDSELLPPYTVYKHCTCIHLGLLVVPKTQGIIEASLDGLTLTVLRIGFLK